MLSWGKAVILSAYCDICINILHIAIYTCTYVGCMLQAKNIVNIDIIGLMRLLSTINCAKAAVISATAVLLICHCCS